MSDEEFMKAFEKDKEEFIKEHGTIAALRERAAQGWDYEDEEFSRFEEDISVYLKPIARWEDNIESWTHHVNSVYKIEEENETAYFQVTMAMPNTEMQFSNGGVVREVEPYQKTVTRYKSKK